MATCGREVTSETCPVCSLRRDGADLVTAFSSGVMVMALFQRYGFDWEEGHHRALWHILCDPCIEKLQPPAQGDVGDKAAEARIGNLIAELADSPVGLAIVAEEKTGHDVS